MKANYIKVKSEKTLRISKCRLHVDKIETTNHILNECSKLVKKILRRYTTEWERWSSGNCAKIFNLTIRISEYAQPRIRPVETSLGFWDTNRSPNLGYSTWHSNSQQKKKRSCATLDLVVLADHIVRLKEKQKKDKYLNQTSELRISGALRIIPKN